MRKFFLLVALILFSSLNLPTALAQSPDEAVVSAVLFFSPTCPHCHKVIQDTLIPMTEEYGSQLQIIGIDVSTEDGTKLYDSTIEAYNIPPERRGVPTLIVDEIVLVGDLEIPEKFPDIVTEGLAKGGIPLSNIPNIEALIPPPTTEATATEAPTAEATIAATATPIATATPAVATLLTEADVLPNISNTETANEDPVGMTIGWVVMTLLFLSLGFAAWRISAYWQDLEDIIALSIAPLDLLKHWIVPVIAIAGLGVAAYLAYVEINHAEAVCGPVGNCNLVQSSAYASIFGVPVAVLGLLNYVGVIILWGGNRQTKLKGIKSISAVMLLALTTFGVIFSIYLTWAELFLINAVCAWCLSSAIITTVLMLIAIFSTTAIPIGIADDANNTHN